MSENLMKFINKKKNTTFKFHCVVFPYEIVYMLIYSINDFVFNVLIYPIMYILKYFAIDLLNFRAISPMIDRIIISFFDTVITSLTDSENNRIDTLLYETLPNGGNATLPL